MKETQYFNIEKQIELRTIEELLNLSNHQSFGYPGKPVGYKPPITPFTSSLTEPYHSTSGLFRGQAKN
jgi:hypothetical protein